MPVTYTNSLRGDAFPQFNKSFLWEDDPAEDASFVGFVRALLDRFEPNLRIRNVVIDRSGNPEFRWENWSNSSGTWAQVGTGSLPIGAVGVYWSDNRSSQGLRIAPVDMDIYWECDVRGRALSIDSLVVP